MFQSVWSSRILLGSGLARDDTWHREVAGWMREDHTTLIWAGGVCRGFIWRVIGWAVDGVGVLSRWHGGGRSYNAASIFWSKTLRLPNTHLWFLSIEPSGNFVLGAGFLEAQNIRPAEVQAWFVFAHAFLHIGVQGFDPPDPCHFNNIFTVWQKRPPKRHCNKVKRKRKILSDTEI